MIVDIKSRIINVSGTYSILYRCPNKRLETKYWFSANMDLVCLALAAFTLFQRTLDGLDIAEGKTKITDSYGTNGTVKATHTEDPAVQSTGK